MKVPKTRLEFAKLMLDKLDAMEHEWEYGDSTAMGDLVEDCKFYLQKMIDSLDAEEGAGLAERVNHLQDEVEKLWGYPRCRHWRDCPHGKDKA